MPWSQSLPDWIASHVRTFAALGGVPEMLVPDNLKAAVHRAHRYEPEINRTYADLAHHYGVAIIPARAAKPRDKAKAEVGVQVAERWIIARLRNTTFFSLPQANEAVAALLRDLNTRPFKKLPGSRQSLFNRSIARPCAPCPHNLTNTPSGDAPASISITMSRSIGITTRSLIPWSNSSSMFG
jgi:transposase